MLKYALAFASLLFTPTVANASNAPMGVAFAGGATGSGTSGYAGVVYSLPGAHLGHGLAVRLSLNGGRYHYSSGDQRIKARYLGGEAALVYQLSGQWGWANLSVGPRVTDTRLSPPDPANDRAGTQVDIGVQSDGAYWIVPSWRLDWIGSVAVRDRAYYSRVGLGPVVDTKTATRVGIEAGIQGDPRYSARQAGAFIATRVAANVDAQVSVGLADQERRRVHPYVALGASLLF